MYWFFGLLDLAIKASVGVGVVYLLVQAINRKDGVERENVLARLKADPKAEAIYYGLFFAGACFLGGCVVLGAL